MSGSVGGRTARRGCTQACEAGMCEGEHTACGLADKPCGPVCAERADRQMGGLQDGRAKRVCGCGHTHARWPHFSPS
jgi:hypothetical protein